ncbi:MAG: Gfo/Idh/MocA family oxidoreductase [Anaerovoracaceae bacterium]
MKYAIIGCSRVAVNHIKSAIDNNMEIVGVCDISEEAMDNLLKEFNLDKDPGIKRFTDFKEMIGQQKPAIVSITTGSGSHAKIALGCIEEGVNLIIEKPIAMSITDADEILKAADSKGLKVCVSHQNRYNIAIQKLRKALEEGRFGKLSHGSINVRWNRDKAYYDLANWRGTWAQDGGCLMNQCVHGIDLLIWMMGPVTEVYGVTRQHFHDYIEAEDLGTAILKFESGAVGTIEGTTNIYPENLEETLCIFGETGTVKIGGTSVNNIDVWKFADERPEDKEALGFHEETENVYGNGHYHLFKDMINAVKENKVPYVNGEAGRNAIEIILAIYKSQKTGLPVKLPLKGFASIDMAGEFDK